MSFLSWLCITKHNKWTARSFHIRIFKGNCVLFVSKHCRLVRIVRFNRFKVRDRITVREVCDKRRFNNTVFYVSSYRFILEHDNATRIVWVATCILKTTYVSVTVKRNVFKNKRTLIFASAFKF